MVDSLLFPQITAIGGAIVEQVQSAQFRQDAIRTGITVGASVVMGGVAGICLGAIGWRWRIVGQVMEPYLVSLYALPTLVFYPLMLTIMGLGPGPIIVIASISALVPIALNTMIALRSVGPVLLKAGRSFHCSPRQLYWKILFPAATPLAATGIRLGFMYAMIATIAMEFILASKGLGFRIGFYFEEFSFTDMWAGIAIIALAAVIVINLLTRGERRVRKDML